jgi:hypothetical protein
MMNFTLVPHSFAAEVLHRFAAQLLGPTRSPKVLAACHANRKRAPAVGVERGRLSDRHGIGTSQI